MNFKRIIAAVLCASLCAASASCSSDSSDSSSSNRRNRSDAEVVESEPSTTSEDLENYIEWKDNGWYLHVSDSVEKYNVMALWSDPNAEKQGSRLQVYEEDVTAKELFLTDSITAKDMVAFVHVLDENDNETEKITCGVKK